jgi:hypothetical protein
MSYLENTPTNGKSQRAWPWGCNTVVAKDRADAAGMSYSTLMRVRRLARCGDTDLLELALLGLITLPEAEKVMFGRATTGIRNILV